MRETETKPRDWTEDWGDDMALSYCQACAANFIVSLAVEIAVCPYCGQAVLTYLHEETAKPAYTHAPELLLPFSAPKEIVQQNMKQFVKNNRFAPADLTPQHLETRLQPLYLPFWLVDATVEAQWQAEVGFDYQIVSHREKYGDNGWQSQKIKETKIRWEPRVGQLNRHYDNQTAPALEEHEQWRSVLGGFQTDSSEPYQAGAVAGIMVRLPNRPPDDAWPEAEASLKTAATAEVRQATKADHIRQFRWSAAYSAQHWTQMLLPIFATYYRDDDEVVRMVYVHGQTGALVGQQRASLQKAKRYATFIGVGAALLFTVSLIFALLGFFEASLLPWAFLGFMAAIGLAITAVFPFLIAYSINNWGMFADVHQKRLAALREAIGER